MITEEKVIKEYREDGSLRYECTLAYLSKETEHLYENRRQDPESGKCFIRIKHAAKYRKDGSLEWKLIYNHLGVAVHDGTRSLIRKDTS